MVMTNKWLDPNGCPSPRAGHLYVYIYYNSIIFNIYIILNKKNQCIISNNCILIRTYRYIKLYVRMMNNYCETVMLTSLSVSYMDP